MVLIARIFIFLILPINCWADDSLVVGVAEENINRAGYKVRPLFLKNDQSWVTLDSEKKVLELGVNTPESWNLVFDGRLIGSLKTEIKKFDGYSNFFKRDHYFPIVDDSSFPKLGNREKRFGTWMGYPVNRPIAVNSLPFYKDNETWKRNRNAKAANDLLNIVFPSLDTIIEQAYHCDGPPNWGWSKFELTVDDIQIFKVYENNLGNKLFSAGLASKHTTDCDGPLDSTSKPVWFYLDNELNTIGFELDLLEVADFDGDKEVEFLFWHAGYNEDGYKLYESGFKSSFEYYWSYH